MDDTELLSSFVTKSLRVASLSCSTVLSFISFSIKHKSSSNASRSTSGASIEKTALKQYLWQKKTCYTSWYYKCNKYLMTHNILFLKVFSYWIDAVQSINKLINCNAAANNSAVYGLKKREYLTTWQSQPSTFYFKKMKKTFWDFSKLKESVIYSRDKYFCVC